MVAKAEAAVAGKHRSEPKGLRSVESFNGHPVLAVSNNRAAPTNYKRGAALNSISDGEEERRNDGKAKQESERSRHGAKPSFAVGRHNPE